MGGFIKIDAERVETTPLNTQINKEVFDEFKVRVKTIGYPLNIVLEVFMLQYANDRFEIKSENILKWKKDKSETDTLNTTFNKEIYHAFKSKCKENGSKYGEKFFIKHVITAFMEEYTNGNYIMEYVNTKDIEE